MNSDPQPGTILFEPWSLGDAIIAASVWRELPDTVALACHPQWHPTLRAAVPEKSSASLVAVNLPYTARARSHPLHFAGEEQQPPSIPSPSLVLSIRGDPRDRFAARRIFPGATIRMTGWIRFLARKHSVVDLPYSLGLRPVQNRYRSWAELAAVPYTQIESTYARLRAGAPRNGRVVVHLGAQWRSKQFPHVVELRALLEKKGHEVVLIAAESDMLAPGIGGEDVVRAEDEALIDILRSAEHVITNDSGPMHLAAFLGCRTTAVVRAAAIEEWTPPGIEVIAAEETPRGYRQRKHYMTDGILSGWPAPQTVAANLQC